MKYFKDDKHSLETHLAHLTTVMEASACMKPQHLRVLRQKKCCEFRTTFEYLVCIRPTKGYIDSDSVERLKAAREGRREVFRERSLCLPTMYVLLENILQISQNDQVQTRKFNAALAPCIVFTV